MNDIVLAYPFKPSAFWSTSWPVCFFRSSCPLLFGFSIGSQLSHLSTTFTALELLKILTMDSENHEALNALVPRTIRDFYLQNPNADLYPFNTGFQAPLVTDPTAFHVGIMMLNRAITPRTYPQVMPAAMNTQGL